MTITLLDIRAVLDHAPAIFALVLSGGSTYQSSQNMQDIAERHKDDYVREFERQAISSLQEKVEQDKQEPVQWLASDSFIEKSLKHVYPPDNLSFMSVTAEEAKARREEITMEAQQAYNLFNIEAMRKHAATVLQNRVQYEFGETLDDLTELEKAPKDTPDRRRFERIAFLAKCLEFSNNVRIKREADPRSTWPFEWWKRKDEPEPTGPFTKCPSCKPQKQSVVSETQYLAALNLLLPIMEVPYKAYILTVWDAGRQACNSAAHPRDNVDLQRDLDAATFAFNQDHDSLTLIQSLARFESQEPQLREAVRQSLTSKWKTMKKAEGLPDGDAAKSRI